MIGNRAANDLFSKLSARPKDAGIDILPDGQLASDFIDVVRMPEQGDRDPLPPIDDFTTRLWPRRSLA